MILSRASRLVLLHWQGQLYPYAEKVLLPQAQAILCGEHAPDDQSATRHVAVVNSRANLMTGHNPVLLAASLRQAQVAEGLLQVKHLTGNAA